MNDDIEYVKCKCRTGWLHYSDGSPLDVCEDCHGTGLESAYSAYDYIEKLNMKLRMANDELAAIRKTLIAIGEGRACGYGGAG